MIGSLMAAKRELRELSGLAESMPVYQLKALYDKRAIKKKETIKQLENDIRKTGDEGLADRKLRAEAVRESARNRAAQVRQRAEEHKVVLINREVRSIIRRKALRLVEMGDIKGAHWLAVQEADESLRDEIRIACAGKHEAIKEAQRLVRRPECLEFPKETQYVIQMNSLLIGVDRAKREIGRLAVSGTA